MLGAKNQVTPAPERGVIVWGPKFSWGALLRCVAAVAVCCALVVAAVVLARDNGDSAEVASLRDEISVLERENSICRTSLDGLKADVLRCEDELGACNAGGGGA